MGYTRTYRAVLTAKILTVRPFKKVFRGGCSLLNQSTWTCSASSASSSCKGTAWCLVAWHRSGYRRFQLTLLMSHCCHNPGKRRPWVENDTHLTFNPAMQNICSWFIFPIFKEATELHIVIFFNTLNRPSTWLKSQRKQFNVRTETILMKYNGWSVRATFPLLSLFLPLLSTNPVFGKFVCFLAHTPSYIHLRCRF